MLRGAIGTPIRRIDRANRRLALADPEPLTLAKRMTKSFTAWIGIGCPACAISMVNFIMSQAPVGQRSAQSPQCRQRSSSLTMTRRVLTGSET